MENLVLKWGMKVMGDYFNTDLSTRFVFPDDGDFIGKYRISLDDNILCLEDLTRNKNIYTSITDKPYLNATAECIKEDIELVHREILRFAGPESLSEVTTLHWGACNEEGVRALLSQGYRGLVGFFSVTDSGETRVAYCYSYDLVQHLKGRSFWVDTKENIAYGKVDMVVLLNG